MCTTTRSICQARRIGIVIVMLNVLCGMSLVTGDVGRQVGAYIVRNQLRPLHGKR